MGINDKAWDGGFRRAVGDASLGATLALAVDTTTKQLHVCDIADVGTDWARSASSHPELLIHSATNPATEYIKMYHDATNAYIDGVGATTVQILVAGTSEVSISSSAVAPTTTNGAALGSTSLMWSDLFLASGGVINFDNGNLTMTHSSGKLAVAATWTTAAMTGRPLSSTLTMNAAGGSYFNALKGQLTMGTSGSTTGVASAICAEVSMSTVDDAGAYACLELEMTHPATGGGSLAQPCFIYANATGATSDTWFDPYGAFVTLGTGVTAGASNILSTDSQTLICRMGALQATVRYLVLSQSENILHTNVSALGADARASRMLATCATPAMTDGYGAFEQELNVTGTATGLIQASSRWINLGTSAVVPSYLTLANDGIWDGTATLTNAYISMHKYQCLLASNPAWLCIWELNFQQDANNEIDAIFNVNDATRALGYQAGTPTKAAVGSIPFCSTAGSQLRYIYLYDAPDSD